jgi:alpha-tubulin suppressor-like RCC1 family protein
MSMPINPGTVWTCGYNFFGQLGDGTTSDRLEPIVLRGLRDAVQIAAGKHHNLVLRANGLVVAWGNNLHGQIGDGNIGHGALTPFTVTGLADVIAVATGEYHSLALKRDGTVWSWGENAHGELGDGTLILRTRPVQVAGLTNIVSIGAGYGFSLAVRNDGTVWCWGDNTWGQLGNGTTNPSPLALEATGPGNAIAVAGGEYHSLALTASGKVFGWGANFTGQLGTGGMDSRVPVATAQLDQVVQIAAGRRTSLGMKADGTVWAWGSVIGNGTTFSSQVPIRVTALSGVTRIAGGGEFNLAVTNHRLAWSWGDNHKGQLGDGTTRNALAPVQIHRLQRAVGLAGGAYHSAGIIGSAPGLPRSWGSNEFGQLGDATTNDTTTAGPVAYSEALRQISASEFHSLGLALDGTVWAWGLNFSGQLGDGSKTDRHAPIQVSGLSDVMGIAAGQAHSLALKTDGTVWGWGYNGYGQLGNGSTTESLVPVQANVPDSAVAIALGVDHSLALLADGSVWGWGANFFNQTGASSGVPVQVPGLSRVEQIAAAGWFSLALLTDGTVHAWGSNEVGQLGDGTLIDRFSPVQTSGLPGSIIAIAAGGFHAMALAEDGSVFQWGYDGLGPLVTGFPQSGSPTPVKVIGLPRTIAIAGGTYHKLSLAEDGTVWAWGAGGRGQLGNGAVTSSAVPVRATNLADVVAISGGGGHSLALLQVTLPRSGRPDLDLGRQVIGRPKDIRFEFADLIPKWRGERVRVETSDPTIEVVKGKANEKPRGFVLRWTPRRPGAFIATLRVTSERNELVREFSLRGEAIRGKAESRA